MNQIRGFLKKPIESHAGLLLFILFFFFFLWHLCPSLYWRDPGEFAAIGYTLSVGHPTGSPTYSLIAKLFTFLPFGSIFQKINLASAVFGSLTVCLVFRLVLSIAGVKETYFSRRTFWAFFSALAAALLLAVSPTFWLYSLVAKGYPQLTFWIIIIILLLLRFREEAEKVSANSPLSSQGQSLFFAAAFLFGLSLGTYGAMVLYLPAFLAYCFLIDRRWYRNPKILVLGVFFFILGFSVYLYLPLRSSTTPFLDWGEPKTLSRFINHLMDAKDYGHNVSFPWAFMGTLSWNSLKVLTEQFTPFGILLGVIGAAALFYKDRPFFWLTFGIAIIHWVFFVRLWEMAFLYIPLFLIFAIWIGLGVFYVGKAFETGSRKRLREEFKKGVAYALCGGVLITVLLQYAVNRPSSGKNDYYVPYAVGKEMLLSLPPQSILFSFYSTMLFHGLRSVENFRPDVSVVVIPALRTPQIFWSLDRAHYPFLDFEALPRVVHPDSIDFFTKLIDVHIVKVPLYLDFSPEYRWAASRLMPERLLYRIHKDETTLSDEMWGGKLNEFFDIFQFLSSSPGFMEDMEGRQFLKDLASFRSNYYLTRGFIPSALSCNRLAIRLNTARDSSLYNDQALLLRYLNRPEEALKSWDQALAINPLNPSPLINRGIFFHRRGDYERSLKDWDEAIRIGGQGVAAYYYRAMAKRERGKPREALADLESFLSKSWKLHSLFADDPMFDNARKLIEEISAELASEGCPGKPPS